MRVQSIAPMTLGNPFNDKKRSLENLYVDSIHGSFINPPYQLFYENPPLWLKWVNDQGTQ